MFERYTKLVIGNDHAGYEMKVSLAELFSEEGYDITDMGTYTSESADYPDFAREVCKSVLTGEAETGILICGTGNGMAMAANKNKGIRAALCWTGEIARLARLHNDANILVLPARFISTGEAEDICRVFFMTAFEGGRHLARVEKVDNLRVQ